MNRKKINHGIWAVAMTAVSVLMLTPVIMMFLTSFKSMEEVKSSVFHLLPEKISLTNYIAALGNGNWLIYFRNSLIITISAVAFSLIFNSVAGYAFARLKFKGSKILFAFLLVGLMMPAQVTILPTFLIMAKFPLMGGNNILGQGGTGMINTFAGLIIPLVSGSYGIFLCKQFYENFPKSLDEAALMDGATRAQILVQMIIPLSKPIIIYTALLAFMAPWCDYVFASYVALGNSDSYNVAVAMQRWVWTNDYQGYFTRFCAGGILVAVPVTILFMCLQKYYVEGVTGGAVKG